MSARRPGATDLLVVSVGGAAGAVLRFAFDTAAPVSRFPWPALAMNVVGGVVL
ncbi:MAG: CrcB family protein, partial [Actinobacteria bacterium]|nr:CrcB family protein [Actinomycetota bacterium]